MLLHVQFVGGSWMEEVEFYFFNEIKLKSLKCKNDSTFSTKSLQVTLLSC